MQNANAARDLTTALALYRLPSLSRSVVEILVTALPLVIIWVVMWVALTHGEFWLYVALIVPAAGFLVRLFMIQHDCGHGAFFATRRLNDWIRGIIGVLTLTPYGHWRRTHAAHHAGAGNLDRRGIGDVETLTVKEYLTLPRWRRFRYRLYRHPTIMFGLGSAYLFFVANQLPIGVMKAGWQPWASTMGTNAGIAALMVVGMWLVGVSPFLLLYIPVALLAASLGVWLFYVQHQFEETLWEKGSAWNLHEAALHGSSHYELPPILAWFTANIGVHHVRHLSSRIPYYRLPQVLRDHPDLRAVGRLTLLQSLRCVRLALWDEDRKRWVTFRDAHLR